VPTAGKAPGSGSSSTGREPHAIPGVTLPFAVILTAHRLHPPLHPAQQTALSLGVIETSKSCICFDPRINEQWLNIEYLLFRDWD
jgi:hypothetical protein